MRYIVIYTASSRNKQKCRREVIPFCTFATMRKADKRQMYFLYLRYNDAKVKRSKSTGIRVGAFDPSII